MKISGPLVENDLLKWRSLGDKNMIEKGFLQEHSCILKDRENPPPPGTSFFYVTMVCCICITVGELPDFVFLVCCICVTSLELPYLMCFWCAASVCITG